MIKTIIFDYAGVITPTRDKVIFAKKYHHQFGMEPSKLLDILYKNWDKAAINEISAKDYWQKLGQDLNMEPEKIRRMILDSFPIEKRIIRLINKIRNKYTLVMLSNQIEDWLEEVIDQNNLRDKFHHFANSYQIRLSKPDNRIFLAALEKSGSKPEETLFIDDSEKNIQAAHQLGMQTILFKNFNQFLKEFEKLTAKIKHL